MMHIQLLYTNEKNHYLTQVEGQLLVCDSSSVKFYSLVYNNEYVINFAYSKCYN